MSTFSDLMQKFGRGENATAGFLLSWFLGVDTNNTAVTWAPKVTATIAAGSLGAQGAANIATGQVALSTSPATLAAARATRRSVLIKNIDPSITIYIGPATVSSSNGLPLKAGESVSVDWVGLVQAVSASGTPTAAYVETYD